MKDGDTYWKLLDEGIDAVGRVPRARWDAEALYDPDPDARGKVIAKEGGFLDRIDEFDAAFFGVSPREAVALDPQQRLLLETSWEALEHAGWNPERLAGSDTGVFVGLMYQEYAGLSAPQPDLDGYVLTGSLASVASGRVSYVLGLKGPTLTVDTACSSSLVTIHLACQALRRGECSSALAGGVTLMLTPAPFLEFSRLRGLSPDGRCKSFAASADGVGWSEGCGMLALKRLSDARRDGDRILALIRGSAVKHDGRSNGLTAPNGASQEMVIERALRDGGVNPLDIGYVECHGTGTKLGDPIEVNALGKVLGPGRERPVVIGSVKSNLGHTQAAAGVAGVIKVLLSLEREKIPKSLHFAEPSPYIAWSGLPVQVAGQAMPWPRGDRPRIAGVSSFGISGTNAHVVRQEPPEGPEQTAREEQGAQLFVVSAKSEAALAAQCERLEAYLETHPEEIPADIALSLATTRLPMDERLAMVASTVDDLRALLLEASRGRTPAGVSRGTHPAGDPPKVVFVFPGQGSQWLGMGRGLLATELAFRDAFAECDRAIQAEAGWSPLAEIAAGGDASRLDRVDVVQPILFAFGVALAALWRSWGVEADAVVGHSMGEVAAAHVAGALSLEDAIAVICRRSTLLRRISGQGEMAVVDLSSTEAASAIAGYEDRLGVAACNSPRSTVLSGEPAALGEVLRILESKGVFCRRVRVDVASHSPQVDSLHDDLLAVLAGLRPAAARIPIRSTVLGKTIEGTELTATYWWDNLRNPVRFAGSVQALMAESHGVFIEMSPHPILLTSVEEIRLGTECKGIAVGSVRREQDERATLLEALGALWVRGHRVAWDRVFPAGARRVPLPTYAWQRESYWPKPDRAAKTHGSGHPLLGESHSLSTSPGVRWFETSLDLERLPWLADHCLHRAVVFPAAGYLEMALASGAAMLGAGGLEIADLRMTEVLELAVDGGQPVQFVATEEKPGSVQCQISSRIAGGAWRSHASGTMRRTERQKPGRVDLGALRARFATGPVAGDVAYGAFTEVGLEYGPGSETDPAVVAQRGRGAGSRAASEVRRRGGSVPRSSGAARCLLPGRARRSAPRGRRAGSMGADRAAVDPSFRAARARAVVLRARGRSQGAGSPHRRFAAARCGRRDRRRPGRPPGAAIGTAARRGRLVPRDGMAESDGAVACGGEGPLPPLGRRGRRCRGAGEGARERGPSRGARHPGRDRCRFRYCRTHRGRASRQPRCRRRPERANGGSRAREWLRRRAGRGSSAGNAWMGRGAAALARDERRTGRGRRRGSRGAGAAGRFRQGDRSRASGVALHATRSRSGAARGGDRGALRRARERRP